MPAKRQRLPPGADVDRAATRAILVIVAAVVLANAPYLLGIFEPNPLPIRSGLASSYTAGPLPGVNALDPADGWVAQAEGHRAALDVLRLTPPWWNPYSGTGAPLAAEMQSAALFPPTILTGFSNGQIYERLLLEIIAGIGTYLLLRRLRVGQAASTAAGIAFALNGTFAWFAHAPINPIAFLPLLLLGIERSYTATVEGRAGGWWLIAVAGALSFYAGFPEVAYIDGCLAFAWLAWRAIVIGRARLRPLLAKAAAGIAVGVLLAAPLLVAFVGYLGHADTGGHESSVFGHTHLPVQALPRLLLPYIYGPPFAFNDRTGTLALIWGNVGGYVSLTLLFFALLAFASGRSLGLKAMLAGWVVLAVSRNYGVPVLGAVLGVLPGMDRIAFYRYSLPATELAVVLLAGLGIDALAARRVPRRAATSALIACLAVLAGLVVVAAPLGAGTYSRVSMARALILLLVAAVLSGAFPARTLARACAVVVVVEAVALFALPEFSAPRRATLDTAPVAYLRRHLGESRYLSLGPLRPNYGAYFGLASLSVLDNPVPQLFADYVHTRLDRFVQPTHFVGDNSGGRSALVPPPREELVRNLDSYRAAAVAYVITPRRESLPESASTFTKVFQSPSARIYRLAGAATYFTATNRRCVTRPQGRTAAWLRCRGATTLVRRETDFPGWTARVDGRRVPINRYGGLFQAIEVRGGAHRVTFSYRPRHIAWGYAGFLAGCAWLLLCAVGGRRAAKAGMPEA